MTDLLSLVERDTTLKRAASTNGGEYVGPCPFCPDGGTNRFHVWPNDRGGRWWCRRCERSGDAIAYQVERGDLTPQEAGRLRHGTGRLDVRPSQTATRREPLQVIRPEADAPTSAWQDKARVFVDYCQEQLHGDAGQVGLDWLHERGLSDDTIRLWRLGWHGSDRWRDPGQFGLNGGKKVWLARGVTIPWTVDGAIWHVKTRRFDDDGPVTGDDKWGRYVGVRGGQPTLFGLDHLAGKRVVVICEGELDAVLLHQEAGDLVDVVAIGSKGAKVALSYLARLVGAARWLLSLDADADEAADWWGEFSARVRRARPLQGNDLTEFHQAGGDLRRWVQFHLDRLDIEARPVTEAQAAHLLARIDAGDVGAILAYAELAEREGWPCHGGTWAAWALAVRADLAERKLAATADRLATLERLPLHVGEGALQVAQIGTGTATWPMN